MAKILVIDDEEDMRLLMCAILARGQHEADAASDGETALTMLTASRYDLILCDVSMRGMNGYTLLSRVRALPESAHTPVVLVTGMADLKGMREGMKLGADDYLPKPFTVTELLSVVHTRLDKAKGLRKEAEDRARSLRSHISLMLPQDLLNPLTGILGLAGILCDEAETLTPPEAVELARDIQRSGERLNRQINNFLIYSQIELLSADPARLQAMRSTKPTAVARLLASVSQKVATRHARAADLVVEQGDCNVAISEPNLEKVIGEVVDNAFKFSKKGTPVQITTTHEADVAVICVSNEGDSMKISTLDGIRSLGKMERFSAQRAATGIGLAIALRLTELHNGRVFLGQRDSAGTTVCVELPVATG